MKCTSGSLILVTDIYEVNAGKCYFVPVKTYIYSE